MNIFTRMRTRAFRGCAFFSFAVAGPFRVCALNFVSCVRVWYLICNEYINEKEYACMILIISHCIHDDGRRRARAHLNL